MKIGQFGLLILLGLAACGGDEDKKSWKGKKVDPVTVVEVETLATGAVSELLLANAIVESEAQASILPTAGGVVIAIHRDEGDVVKRGDLLAVLENVSLDANAERARAELQRLEQQVARTAELYERGVVSRRELEDLEHQLSTAKTSDREASTSFGETRLLAPFDGVVAARDVRVGEFAGSSSAAFEVVDLSALRVVASLPERDLPKVKVGQQAKLISAYDDSIWTTGVVSRIAPVVDSTSGTFRVTLGLSPEQQVLRPGQFVSVELEVERREEVPVVPRSAVVYEDGRAVVYRMVPEPPPEEDTDAEEPEEETTSWFARFRGGSDEEENEPDSEGEEEEDEKWIAERRPIERGVTDTEFVQILSGVDLGDSIIVVGQSNLRDGTRVRTPEMSVADGAKDTPDDDAEGQEAQE